MVSTLLSVVALSQSQNLLQEPPEIADPLRLAVTPILDGVVSEEEWEFLTESSGGRTYFQWEPGKLYWAAKAQNRQDVVFTLDANGDGWLVGNDNLEIRCRLNGTQVNTSVRQLDATDRNGPTWVDPDVIAESLTISASPSDTYWNLEVGFEPLTFMKSPDENMRIGARMDIVPSNSDTGPGYMPRGLAFLTMRMDTSEGLFSGLEWRPEVKTRNVSMFDKMRFRLNFIVEEDCPPIRSVTFSGEGFGSRAIESVVAEFPEVDNRGRAFVDFESPINETAVSGYRVLRAEVQAANGRTAVIRTSFEVAQVVDFEPNFRIELPYSAEPQKVKGGVTIQSQVLGRIDGKFSIRYPDEWLTIGTLDRDFLIYHNRGRSRVPVEFVVPGGVRGVFPVRLSAKVGDQSILKTVYVSVGQ